MKKLSWLFGIGIIVIIAVITNPNEDTHIKNTSKEMVNLLKSTISSKEKENIGIGGEVALGVWVSMNAELQLRNIANYNNYILYSTLTNDRGGMLSVGFFGNTHFMIDKEDNKSNLDKSTINQSYPDDYIQMDGYKKLNIKNILKRAKEKSYISGIWEENESYKLKLVELEDNTVLFSIDAYISHIEGIGVLKDNIITYRNDEFGECEITITVKKDRAIIKVLKDYCGLGSRSNPNGIYLLKSRIIPKFNNSN